MNEVSFSSPDSPPRVLHRRRLTVDACVVVGTVALGLVMRWLQLGRASLWFDEGYTAWVVSLSPRAIVNAISVDTAPPLYYLLLHGWTLVFGRSEAALRSLSTLFASVALLLFVPLARRLLSNRRASNIAVVLFALNYLQIAYAHEARFYAMMALLTVLGLAAVLHAIDHPGGPAYSLVFACWTPSLYTNNLMALYVAGGALAWALLPGSTPPRNRVRPILITGMLSIVAFSPWLPAALHQSRMVAGQFWLAPPTLQSLSRATAVLCGVNEQGVDPAAESILTVIPVLLMIACGTGILSRKTRRLTVALAIAGIGPVLLMFVVSRVGTPIFIERALLASGVVLPILLAIPAAQSRRWANLAVAVAAVFAVAEIRSWPSHFRGEFAEDWRGACRYAAERSPAGSTIVFVANEGETLFDFYSRSSNYSPTRELIGLPQDFFAVTPPRTMTRITTAAQLSAFQERVRLRPIEPITLVESHAAWADAEHRTRRVLEAKRPLQFSQSFLKVDVYCFGPAPRTSR